MRAYIGVATAFLLVAAAPAAGEKYMRHIELIEGKPETKVPWYLVATIVPADDKEEIGTTMRRAAQVMHRYSKATRFEACADVCWSKGDHSQLAMYISSNHSHIGCAILEWCPEGFEAVSSIKGQPVHSHPSSGPYTLNAADVVFLTQSPVPTDIGKVGDTHILQGGTFSQTDLLAKRQSWLVAENALWFEDGMRPSPEIMRLEGNLDDQ